MRFDKFFHGLLRKTVKGGDYSLQYQVPKTGIPGIKLLQHRDFSTNIFKPSQPADFFFERKLL
jgi:hypothetical protein